MSYCNIHSDYIDRLRLVHTGCEFIDFSDLSFELKCFRTRCNRSYGVPRHAYFHQSPPPQTMGNLLPCISENRNEIKNTVEQRNNPVSSSSPKNSAIADDQENTVAFDDLAKHKSSSEVSISSPSKRRRSIHTFIVSSNVEASEQRMKENLHCIPSDIFEPACKQTLGSQSRSLLHDTEPSVMSTDFESNGDKASSCTHKLQPVYSKAPSTVDNKSYSTGHSQMNASPGSMVDYSAIQQGKLMPCEISSQPQKEWVPFYSSYFNGPFHVGNSVRWAPYAHSLQGTNFDGLASGQYVLTVHPTNMMQSLPTANRSASRDEISLSPSKELFKAEVNARTESENSEYHQLSPSFKQHQRQHMNWTQGNFLMSTDSRLVDPSIPLYIPQPFMATPPDLTSTERENKAPTNIDEFMKSYMLKTLSPNNTAKKVESPVKPSKRFHESPDQLRTNIASSPPRMSVKFNEDENVKYDKNQRMFSRPRRGRNNWGSHADWQGRDGRRKYHDVKKTRSSEQTDSYVANVQSPSLGVGMMPTRDISPPPTVRTICGKRVTMVDLERKIFIIDLLSSDDCDVIRKMTDDYVRGVYDSRSGAVTWRTLYTYTKQDLPCGEVPGLTARFTNRIMTDVIKIVGEVYCQAKEAAKLRPRSWKEPHLLLYQRIENKPIHTGVEMHYDGCDITWNCMLSKPTEYEGGGTYIRCLRKTVMLNQGQVLVHPGELYHKGIDITKGVRSLIVCFMDGFNPKMIDDSHAKDDKPIYELNVRRY